MQCRGFTLAELMVVILVLVIAAAIVIANIGSTADSQVISAARVLAKDLEVARSMALTTQEPHALVFSTDRQSYKIVAGYAGEAYSSVEAIEHPVRRGKDYEVTLADEGGMESVVVAEVNFGGLGYVTFGSEGEPSSGGSVRLRAGEVEMLVSVAALTGNVSVARVGN